MSGDRGADLVFEAPREWTHVHPISPLLGGWAVVAAVASWWLNQNLPGSHEDVHWSSRLAPIVGLTAGVAALAIGFGYVSWWFHTFRLTDESIEQRKGLLFRQVKQARLDRVQAVDVVQPLVARIVGLAVVSIEVAGGSGSAIKLQFLSLAQAEALRNELLALAAGAALQRREAPHDEGAEASQASRIGAKQRGAGLSLAPAPGSAATAVAAAVERPLVAVPITRAVASILLSVTGIASASVAVIFAGVAVVSGLLHSDLDLLGWIFGGGAIGILFGIFGWISAIAKNLNSSLNFRLGVASDGVRVAHGLLETARQTIPPGRVQAVQLTQHPLWRSKDWWKAVINVAGYHDQNERVSTLLPVGDRHETLLALWSVLPDLGEPDPASTVAVALAGTGAEGGFVAAPRRAMWLDPWQYRRLAYKSTPTALLIRSGRWDRTLVVVPHERTQSLKLVQGPLQRRLGLASVQVHSTPGPVTPVVRHLAIADAIALLGQQAERARLRRKADASERWLAAVLDADAEAGGS